MLIDPATPTEEMRSGLRVVRPLTPPGETSGYGLPPELIRTAVKRAGFLGLVVALMAPCAYLIEHFTQPDRIASTAGSFPFPLVVAVLLFATGAAMCGLAWSDKIRADLMLDLSLVFEVVVAFAISLSENATPWPPDHPIRGVSWNSLWIAMYVVAIPGTYGKSVLSAVAAACMTPFGMLVANVVNQNPMPKATQLIVLLLPPFVAAAWSIPAGRYLYRLGTQVSKARALGSYELIEPIGRGGMGEVWRARHRMLARTAAIKLIRPEMLGLGAVDHNHVVMRRFDREARATAALRCPHTIVLYDYGISGEGNFYYVMELLDGIDLETLVLRFGPQPAGRVVHLLWQAARSLTEAHENGLVHRDVKPRNIFACRMGVEYDFVKVLDFGLVKIRDAEETQTNLTGEGVTTGTPGYMAPEVAMGKLDADGRADLYSLGCVGYWLLTGHPVFAAPTAMATILAHLQETPVPPSKLSEFPIPAALERTLLTCLEKDPSRRLGSAREMANALLACKGFEPWTEQHAEEWWRAHLAPAGAAGPLALPGRVAPA